MSDLRAIAVWIVTEVNAASRFIREPQLWLVLGCGLVLWTLAYQAPYRYQIDIGGNQQTLRQHDDDPYLDNFNDPEPPKLYTYTNHDKIPLRWTRDRSTITLPGLGGQRWNVELKASSSRPDQSTVVSRWSDGTITHSVTVDAQQRIYQFLARVNSAGDLILQFDTPPFETPTDPRTLGLVMFWLIVDQGGGPQLPALRQLALLAMTLALVHLLLRRLAIAARIVLVLSIGLAAIAAALLIRERMALTLMTPRLPLIVGGSYALCLILEPIVERLLPDENLPHAPRARSRPASLAIVGLIVLAVILRLGGVLHPHARFSDDGFNAHKLMSFTGGEVFSTAGLPDDAGGGLAPYPPGQYIVFAPAQLLFPTDYNSLKVLLRVANALWDSLAVGLLWFVMRRSGYRQRTALLSAALYLLPPPILASLSKGEFANIFGQGMALLLLGTLALHARDLQRPRIVTLGAVALALPLFSHLGVTISVVCVLGSLGLIWAVRPEHRRATAALLFAAILVGIFSALCYYTSFTDILLARFSKPANFAANNPAVNFAQKLVRQWGLAYELGIQPLLVGVAALGATLTAFRPRQWRFMLPRPSLGSLLLAWWVGTLLSLGLLIFASQGVRWQAFFYPVLCFGTGSALAHIWPRGRVGRLVVLVIVGYLLWSGLLFWITQIRTYSP
jgi:hypothetical protein